MKLCLSQNWLGLQKLRNKLIGKSIYIYNVKSDTRNLFSDLDFHDSDLDVILFGFLCFLRKLCSSFLSLNLTGDYIALFSLCLYRSTILIRWVAYQRYMAAVLTRCTTRYPTASLTWCLPESYLLLCFLRFFSEFEPWFTLMNLLPWNGYQSLFLISQLSPNTGYTLFLFVHASTRCSSLLFWGKWKPKSSCFHNFYRP